MNRKIIASFLFLIGLLINLTGNAEQSTTRQKPDIDIVFIGNSITYGAGLENPKQDTPPAIAAEILRKKPAIGSVSFVNQGRSGYTTVNYLPSNDTFAKVVEAAQQLHSNPSHQLIFSIKLGTNDSAIEGPKGAPVSKEDYRQNLKAIIDELLKQFPGSKIVLQQPIWYSPNTYNRSKYLAEGLERLQSYFPELKSLVKSYSKIQKDRVSLGDQKGFSYFRKNYLTDLEPEKGNQGTFYLHPNKKGALQLGNFWAEAIYKAIKHK